MITTAIIVAAIGAVVIHWFQKKGDDVDSILVTFPILGIYLLSLLCVMGQSMQNLPEGFTPVTLYTPGDESRSSLWECDGKLYERVGMGEGAWIPGGQCKYAEYEASGKYCAECHALTSTEFCPECGNSLN